jgi:hypothetical protein
MSGIVLLVAVLICPLVMGTAMLLMWREMRRGSHGSTAEDRAAPPEPLQSNSTASQSDEAHARRA